MTSDHSHESLLPVDLPQSAALYLRPVAMVSGAIAGNLVASGHALPIAGGPIAFPACEVCTKYGGGTKRIVATCQTIRKWAKGLPPTLERRIDLLFSRLSEARAWPDRTTYARPRLMGILNVTPDSFSDPGAFADPGVAIQHAAALAAAGADIIDVGGESTRPGALPADSEVEAERVLPVIRGLAEAGLIGKGVLCSIDTRSAAVMERATEAGADMINDVSALSHDPLSLKVAAKSRASVVLMHMQGEPPTMNEKPAYDDVVLDVFDYLEARIEACIAGGIARERLIVDPGIAFGKGSRENLKILGSLSIFHGLGCPVLIGASRKGLTGDLERTQAPEGRLPASLAAVLAALDQGIQVLRVHDVAETRQAVSIWRNIAQASR